MQFTKMHGLGNDFIMIHRDNIIDNVSNQAIAMCDRHFGIGADGLVFVLPSEEADFKMHIFNSDGSEAEQCGNAIRCVSKYVYDQRLTDKTELKIETNAGIKTVSIEVRNGKADLIRVNMGEPVLQSEFIPTVIPQSQLVAYPLMIGNQKFQLTALSMGVPHVVIYVNDVQKVPLSVWGPLIENDPLFPQKTNVNFIQVHHPTEMSMRVWERGAGPTLACGTGACASVVSSVLNKLTERNVLVHLEGGDLFIEWDEGNNHVYMTGPATEVYTGKW